MTPEEAVALLEGVVSLLQDAQTSNTGIVTSIQDKISQLGAFVTARIENDEIRVDVLKRVTHINSKLDGLATLLADVEALNIVIDIIDGL